MQNQEKIDIIEAFKSNLLDDKHPFSTVLGLYNKESWVLHNHVLIDGEDAWVSIPDPGDRVSPDLPDPAGQVDGLPNPHCNIWDRLWREIWSCVKSNKVLGGEIWWLEAADESWKEIH